jgi:hypothetical protein
MVIQFLRITGGINTTKAIEAPETDMEIKKQVVKMAQPSNRGVDVPVEGTAMIVVLRS